AYNCHRQNIMTILEGRGLFWWADDPIPLGQFAPDSCVPGLLRIEDDGDISLELDNYLPTEHGPMSAILRQELPSDKRIRGLLKGAGQHILLDGLIRNGGQMSSNSISYERYVASACLVSEGKAVPQKLLFKRLIVPLSGYEQWLKLGAIKVTRTRRSV